MDTEEPRFHRNHVYGGTTISHLCIFDCVEGWFLGVLMVPEAPAPSPSPETPGARSAPFPGCADGTGGPCLSPSPETPGSRSAPFPPRVQRSCWPRQAFSSWSLTWCPAPYGECGRMGICQHEGQLLPKLETPLCLSSGAGGG